MSIPLQYTETTHEAIRQLLAEVVTSAAAAELDPYPEHVALARASFALQRALLRHALCEHERRGRVLDRIHDAESAAAMELRHALGLEDVLAQVATIGELLAEEEQLLSSREEPPCDARC